MKNILSAIRHDKGTGELFYFILVGAFKASINLTRSTSNIVFATSSTKTMIFETSTVE